MLQGTTTAKQQQWLPPAAVAAGLKKVGSWQCMAGITRVHSVQLHTHQGHCWCRGQQASPQLMPLSQRKLLAHQREPAAANLQPACSQDKQPVRKVDDEGSVSQRNIGDMLPQGTTSQAAVTVAATCSSGNMIKHSFATQHW
jgi:hypothetical protein